MRAIPQDEHVLEAWRPGGEQWELARRAQAATGQPQPGRATPSKVTFVRQGLVLAGTGVMMGLGAAAGLTRLMSSCRTVSRRSIP